MSNDVSRSNKEEDRQYLEDPKQPLLQGKIPKLSESRRVDDVRFFPPIFPTDGKPTQILAVGIAPTPEEASSILATQHAEHYQKPRLLKGPLGQIMKDIVDRFPELQSDNLTYATAIPWLLPKNRRYRPNKDELAWAKPYLRDVVKHTNPQVIVAYGKLAFDQLVDFKIAADDAKGGWFDCEGIPAYLMDPAHQMVTQPWTLDNVITDFKEVARMVMLRNGTLAAEQPVNSMEIRTLEQLQNLVDLWQAGGFKLFSVDGEWKGANFVDGQLRSMQFAWTNHDGAYLNFFNEHGEPILGRTQMPEMDIRKMLEEGMETVVREMAKDCEVYGDAFISGAGRKVAPIGASGKKGPTVPIGITPAGVPAKPGEAYVDYAAVAKILDPVLNDPDTRFIGHFCSADTTWLERWLGVDIYGKFVFDSAFAVQTVSEYAPLGLERLALQVTNFGRYDMPLVLCKKELKLTKTEGYGRIPDSILVPYGCLDAIVPFRAKPILEDELRRQGTLTYFQTFVMPLVSDTFHTFAMVGLPVDMELFNATRAFMNWAYRELHKDFIGGIEDQADQLLSEATNLPTAVLKAMRENQPVAARNWVLQQCPTVEPALLDHWVDAKQFNIQSSDQKARWLFQVMKLTPVKSTGKPSMMWEKVLTLPEKVQKTMKPAADKETIKILAETPTSNPSFKDMLHRLLMVTNMGTICNGFLAEGDYDSDGELVKEKGMAKSIASDGCLHAMWALTETCRPRTWNPNCLNMAKYLNEFVMNALLRLLNKVEIPQEFEILFGTPEEREGRTMKELIKTKVPSIRSTIKAPPGGCFVESDYKNAEIRGQAFISGDCALIELMVGKDKSFALCKGQPVRLYWLPDTDILPANQDNNLLMAVCEEGKEPAPVKPEDLDRDADGNLIHPPYDLHWSLAETVNKKPREVMNYDKDRGNGKVGNFCVAENEPVLTRDRGWVPIQEITCCDLLWDGKRWVSHEGVIYTGEKEVVEYQGFRGTPHHEVWTREAGKIRLGSAITQKATLERPDLPSGSSQDPRADYLPEYGDAYRRRIFQLVDQVRVLRRGENQGAEEPREGSFLQVPVSEPALVYQAVSGNSVEGVEVSSGSLSSDASEVREGHPRIIGEVSGSRDQMSFPRPGCFHLLGLEGMAGRDFSQKGLRSGEQRRALRAGESAVSISDSQSVEPPVYAVDQHQPREEVQRRASRGVIHGKDSARPAQVQYFVGRHPGEACSEYKGRVEKTYDILNAGPLHRFTCSGVLVSNSGAYGVVAATLELRIEAQTGHKPEEGTGQAILDGLESRQPVSVQFLKDLADYPKNGTLLQAQSGRIRRFPVHSSELKSMPWRVVQGYLRTMGNEARNFLFQESVAATLARACLGLNNFFRKHGMKSRCNMGLYDSCVTWCPDLAERWVVDAAHTLFMDRINIWCYHGRYMSYPIDTDLVYRWSWKPTKAQKVELHDKTFHPMDPEREKYLLAELAKIEKNFFDSQPWILQRLNVV